MSKLFFEKAKEYAFLTFLFTVPIFFIAGMSDARIFQERYFQAASMALVALFFGNIWLTLFMWLNLALFAYHGAQVGSSQVLSVFLTGILFACSRQFFLKHSIRQFTKPLYLVAALSLIFMLAQAFGVDPINSPTSHKGEILKHSSLYLKTGLFYTASINSIFLTIIGALLIFLNSWLGFLLILPTLDARCSAAMLAWGFLIPFWIYWKARRFFIPAIIIGVLGFGFITYKDFSSDKLTYKSRFENWHLMLKSCLIYPIGYGPDSFRNTHKHKNFMFRSDKDYLPIIEIIQSKDTSIMRYHSSSESKWEERFKGKIPDINNINTWGEAHNEYLELLFQYGILGVILFVCFLREIRLRFILSDKSPEVLALFSVLCVYFLTSTTQFPFHLARLSGIFGVFLGAYWAVTDKSYYTFKGEDNGAD